MLYHQPLLRLTSHCLVSKLGGMTGFIVFETSEGSRLSDYWQQRTKSHLSRVHVVPRMTLFTLSHAPVDLALLAPCTETRKCYLHGSILTLHYTWLGSVKCRDSESGQERLCSLLKGVCVRLFIVCIHMGHHAQVQLIWTLHMFLQLFKLKRM